MLKRLIVSLLTLVSLSTLGRADIPIPNLAQWEAQMLTYGDYWCDYFNAHTPGEIWGLSYYDAGRVYMQIRDYTGDTGSWQPCAYKVLEAYRDEYVLANGGNIAGYWNFSTGVRRHYEDTSDADSKTASIQMSNAGTTFCGDAVSLVWTADANGSREVAYCILNYINNELMGEARRTRLTQAGADNDFTDQALDHLDQWFVTKDFRFPSGDSDVPQCSLKYGYKPFMVALTAQSLIKFYELTSDSRVQSALETAYTTMWADMFDATTQSFPYVNCKTNPGDAWPAFPGPDYDTLLLHVANLAWLYQRTADTDWRDKADALFSSGVQNAWLQGYKQFNQNYITSFDYVQIRQTFDPPIDPPQSTVAVISPLDTTVDVVYGAAGLPYEADCTVTLKDSGGTPITTVTTTEGLAKRLAVFTGRTAVTAYKIAVNCDGTVADVSDVDFTTKATPAGGNRTVPISTGDPPTLPTAECGRVTYDDNAALSTPLTEDNATCGTGPCTVNLTLAAGLWYYRMDWYTAACGSLLAQGAVQALQVE